MDAQGSKLFNGDCEGSRISHVTRIMDLQIVIMVNILSRLPIKSIFRCKIVCKLCILLSINDSVRLLVELKDDVTHPLNRAIMLSPRNTIEHSVYISNPLLGEYFEVKLPEWEKRIQRVAYAFCFNETSGQYKVLRSVVSKLEGRPHVSELEVYTLGVDEKWRNVGEVPEPLCRSFVRLTSMVLFIG
ncbi:hypothetical protein KY289_023009 [Solanum tuberosum]|nr:hypothetical protein KY289_023009 [Solanum tuberosum]